MARESLRVRIWAYMRIASIKRGGDGLIASEYVVERTRRQDCLEVKIHGYQT